VSELLSSPSSQDKKQRTHNKPSWEEIEILE